ncbi:potassium channel family protein [Alkalihalobacillus sp. AL-G]|uniref:potassium channel family protein n=1 Tax=Alkalihalobacillus sp. AL-G TaxID=2926399 RepID=UPI00272CFB53|nr:potassium channel family protein [Alkalihalobacillus sp. AL-G]WLD93991.1 potassium channel family protein [Alkalihalobacillus sp. AL-G]
MDLLFLLLIMCAVALIVFRSLRSFFVHTPVRRKPPRGFISLEDLASLFIVYSIIILGFGTIYLSMLLNDIPVLMEGGFPLRGDYIELAESVSYFSAVTLLSVGYGDITPVGIGRWISIFEALVGYLLPAAFVLSTFTGNGKKSE